MTSRQHFYGDGQRALQDRFETRPLADALEAAIVTAEISDDQRAFIESRDFFFLTTVDADGWPTVSYKGGPTGVVRVEGPTTVVFPGYDGNGMFLSAGNIAGDPRIGLLFIDFETPNRLRMHARATVETDGPVIGSFPGATYVVRAEVENVFPNCARYVHRHVRADASPYVPDESGEQPHPSWKRVDLIQPLLPARDAERTAESGGTITAEEYAERLADGTS